MKQCQIEIVMIGAWEIDNEACAENIISNILLSPSEPALLPHVKISIIKEIITSWIHQVSQGRRVDPKILLCLLDNNITAESRLILLQPCYIITVCGGSVLNKS